MAPLVAAAVVAPRPQSSLSAFICGDAANAGVAVDATIEAEFKSFYAAAGQLNVADVPSEWWVTKKTLSDRLQGLLQVCSRTRCHRRRGSTLLLNGNLAREEALSLET